MDSIDVAVANLVRGDWRDGVLRPQDASDIQAVVRHAWTRASGLTVGIQAGHADVMLDLSRLNQILEIGDGFVRVQAGLAYGELKDALRQAGAYLPLSGVPDDWPMGKIVAGGFETESISGLRAVLSNGDEVECGALDPAHLEALLHRHGFESQAYRAVQRLISSQGTLSPSAGYRIWEVSRFGLFDVSRLMIGSRGQLAVITELTFDTVTADRPAGVENLPKGGGSGRLDEEIKRIFDPHGIFVG